jgi:hypothetical protein
MFTFLRCYRFNPRVFSKLPKPFKGAKLALYHMAPLNLLNVAM